MDYRTAFDRAYEREIGRVYKDILVTLGTALELLESATSGEYCWNEGKGGPGCGECTICRAHTLIAKYQQC